MKSMSNRETSAQGIFNATALYGSRRSLLQGELRGYRAEAAYHESLQLRFPWGRWKIGTGRDEDAIQSQAKGSVKTSCQNGACTP